MNDINPDSSVQSTPAPHTTEPDNAALSLKSSVTSDVHDLTDKAKEVGGGLIDHARQSAEAQISGGKDRVAEGLTGVADAIRHTGEHLKSQDKSGLTEYVVRAADQVEAASDYLQSRNLGAVLTDVKEFARREPALFLGSAFALGLLGGRFLKSSTASPAQPAVQAGANSGIQHQGRGGGAHQTQQRSGVPRPNAQGGSARRTQGGGSEGSHVGSGNGGSVAKLPGAV